MIAIMFEDLEPFLRGLARRQRALAPGETVFLQGDPVRHVFFVIAGDVELVRHQASGAPLVIQRAIAGTILAEASLDSTRYHCAAIAVSKSIVWAISKKDLLRRMAENPNFALAFVRRLAHELQNARFQAEILSMKTVAARLDGWIAWRGSLPPKGEWVGLAAQLGVSPEALYREISKRR
jgi:CRP-like cAMP-binding protein